MEAIERQRVDSALLLLEAGASPRCRDRSRLWDLNLLYSGHLWPQLVSSLLAAGAAPNGSAGKRPLDAAIINGAKDSVSILLAAGADPELGSAERLILQDSKWWFVPVFLRHGSRFATMPRKSVRYVWHQQIPLEVLGLLLCAGVEWAHANFEFLVVKELKHRSLADVMTLARAKTWQEFPDMRPLKLLQSLALLLKKNMCSIVYADAALACRCRDRYSTRHSAEWCSERAGAD